MYSNKSVQGYLDALSAKQATPGGGAASALTGALGAALISMVVRFSLDKAGYERFQPWLRKALQKTEVIRVRLIELSDDDCRAFSSDNLEQTLLVPLEVIDACLAALRLSSDLVKKANRNLVSDVAVGALLLEAAARGAAITIEMNLSRLCDIRQKEMIRVKYVRLLECIERICRMTEVSVGTVIRGQADSRAHKRGSPAPDVLPGIVSRSRKHTGGRESRSARLFKIAKKMR